RSDRAAPPTPGGLTLREALTDPRQWSLNASWLLQGGLVFMVTVHIVPYAHDRGASLAGASLVLTAYGVGALGGRLVSGFASDRLGTLTTVRAGFLAMTLAMIFLVWLPSPRMMLAAMALFGAGFAAADTMVAKVIPDVFGLRAIGAIMGVLNLGWRAGAALGPAVAGFLFDLTGSYVVPFGAAPFGLLAAWAFFALGTSRVHMWYRRGALTLEAHEPGLLRLDDEVDLHESAQGEAGDADARAAGQAPRREVGHVHAVHRRVVLEVHEVYAGKDRALQARACAREHGL